MATFKIIIDKRFKIEKDRYHVTLRVNHKRQVLYLRLGSIMTSKEYETIFVRQSIDKKIIDIRNSYNKYLERGHKIFQLVNPFEPKRFRELFYDKQLNLDKVVTSEDKEIGSIRFLFDNYMQNKLATNQIGKSTAYLMNTSLNNLLSFQSDITYKDINPEFLHRFENWYLNKPKKNGMKNSVASLGGMCRNIRAVLKFNMRKKVIPPTYEYPFEEYKIPNFTPPKRVISVEEIQKIVDFKDFENYWEEYARDIWLLLYRMNGINFVDLLKLKWSDRQGNHFIIIRHKTRRTRRNNIRPIKINVTEKIQSLLNKIGDSESPFVLGLIHDVNYNEVYLNNRNHKLKGKINKYLKIVGKKLKLSMPLDISLARDCYANTLKRANVNLLAISENMNHSDPRTTTLHYLDQFEQDTLDDVNAVIL